MALTSPATGPLSWAAGRLPGGMPVGAGTPMYAASVIKQVVAALAGQAILDRVLDIDTPARVVLPALPSWASEIRVHHLIHHTAGLPGTDPVLNALGLSFHSQLDNELVLDGLARLDRLESPPGRSYGYSNVGYVVLAEVVRVACGVELADLSRRAIFDPLAMTHSHLGRPMKIVLPGRPPNPATVGDGGLRKPDGSAATSG